MPQFCLLSSYIQQLNNYLSLHNLVAFWIILIKWKTSFVLILFLSNGNKRDVWGTTQLLRSWTLIRHKHLYFLFHVDFLTVYYHWREEVKWKLLSRVWLFETPWTVRNSLGRNTGVGSLSLLLGIFPTQRVNPGLLHCRRILYQLNHKGLLSLKPPQTQLCKDLVSFKGRENNILLKRRTTLSPCSVCWHTDVRNRSEM